ncbi:bifunctional 2-polyprenyl-6-hydroxyphenol methylase/3-demethylubiquinol 3-O-methyltransferase UbiG [Herminiimonas sp. CN]|uniref:class I SAM-dependent methyltransferase n=1 Tax=Herminiimonas sp. CN TaxID=1349818 RepID=UPI0004736A3F|nr:class I SAM-dependent methyltransferase [Herminiimonas sp. CN]
MSAPAALHANQDAPSAWVQRFAALIPPGPVLDLACGGGRHARLLAALGHPVLAADRDPAALERAAGPGIVTTQVDLEADGAVWPFEPRHFAAIVVTNYLHRPLFPHILGSLAEGGVLLYETFASGNALYGKPSNPDFLLKRGELLDLLGQHAASMHVLAFEEGYIGTPKPAMVQRICAIRNATGFPAGQPRLF